MSDIIFESDTGESQESLHLAFRIGQSTISGIIKETVHAIHTVLKKDYLRFPDSIEEWMAVAHDINERWNFANCLGAMDGKHFVLEQPINSGSMFRNYKGDYSVVLLAIVDAQLRFIFIDVGTNGRASDRGIWNNSKVKQYLEKIDIPQAPLPARALRVRGESCGGHARSLAFLALQCNARDSENRTYLHY